MGAKTSQVPPLSSSIRRNRNPQFRRQSLFKELVCPARQLLHVLCSVIRENLGKRTGLTNKVRVRADDVAHARIAHLIKASYFLDGVDKGTRIPPHISHHQLSGSLLFELDELVRILQGESHRFLDEDDFAVF